MKRNKWCLTFLHIDVPFKESEYDKEFACVGVVKDFNVVMSTLALWKIGRGWRECLLPSFSILCNKDHRHAHGTMKVEMAMHEPYT